MLVNYFVGERESRMTGVGRYRKMIYTLLKDKVDFNLIEYEALPIIAPFQRYVLYPLTVKRKLRDGIVHITGQQQSYLLHEINPDRSIVTVYDVFNLYVREDPKLRSELRKNQGFIDYHFFMFETNAWSKALVKAKRIIAISEFTKNEITKKLGYPKEQIDVTHLGVDTKMYKPLKNFKPPKTLTEKIILHVGGSELRENTNVLLKALYKVKKKISEIKLIKIGSAGKEFLNLAAELNLIKNITCIGHVSEKDLPAYYNSADVLVYPSIYEGFGLPPLEAMACGLPAVTSNVAALPEVVGDAGIMKNPNDVEGFANAIYSVLTDDGLREALIEKGLKRAKKFSWEKTAKRTLEIYREVYEQK
ncbi:MAG: glycosyltransferase family 1 protein [Candidatus Hadarchaeales archaeon]